MRERVCFSFLKDERTRSQPEKGRVALLLSAEKVTINAGSRLALIPGRGDAMEQRDSEPAVSDSPDWHGAEQHPGQLKARVAHPAEAANANADAAEQAAHASFRRALALAEREAARRSVRRGRVGLFVSEKKTHKPLVQDDFTTRERERSLEDASSSLHLSLSRPTRAFSSFDETGERSVCVFLSETGIVCAGNRRRRATRWPRQRPDVRRCFARVLVTTSRS